MSLERQISEKPSRVDDEMGRGKIQQRRKHIPHRDYARISEDLIERDFFPQLRQLKKKLSQPSSSLVELGSDIIDLSEESLDTFKDQYNTLDGLKIYETGQKSRKISDGAKNAFMFNHPGIADSIELKRPRKGINYENTRLETDWGSELEKSARSEAIANARRILNTGRKV